MIIHNKEHNMESLQEQFGFDVTYAAMQKQPFMGKRIQKSTGYAYKLELLENGNYISKLLDESLLENNELFEVNEEVMEPVGMIEESVVSDLTETVNESTGTSSPGLSLINKILEQNGVNEGLNKDNHDDFPWREQASKKLPGADNVSFGKDEDIRVIKSGKNGDVTVGKHKTLQDAVAHANQLSKESKGGFLGFGASKHHVQVTVGGKTRKFDLKGKLITDSTIENINAALKLDESSQFIDEEELVEYLDSHDFHALDESTKVEIISIISNTMNEARYIPGTKPNEDKLDPLGDDYDKEYAETYDLHHVNKSASDGGVHTAKAPKEVPKEPGKVGRPEGEYGNYKRHKPAEEVGKNVHFGRALSHEKLMSSLGSLIGQFNLDTHINRAATLPHPMYHDALVQLIVNHIKDNPDHEASQHSRFNGKDGDALTKAARAVAKIAIQKKGK